MRSALHQWRSQILKRDFEDAVFAPSGILSDKCVENLSSVGFVDRLNELERVVGLDWPWFGQYGDELLEELKKMDIPPMEPKLQKKTAEKQVHELDEEDDQRVTKKKRGQKEYTSTPTQNPNQTPIAVTVIPTPLSHSATSTTYSTTPLSTPNSYLTYQYYGTPQLPYSNPYSFMR